MKDNRIEIKGILIKNMIYDKNDIIDCNDDRINDSDEEVDGEYIEKCLKDIYEEKLQEREADKTYDESDIALARYESDVALERYCKVANLLAKHKREIDDLMEELNINID